MLIWSLVFVKEYLTVSELVVSFVVISSDGGRREYDNESFVWSEVNELFASTDVFFEFFSVVFFVMLLFCSNVVSAKLFKIYLYFIIYEFKNKIFKFQTCFLCCSITFKTHRVITIDSG